MNDQTILELLLNTFVKLVELKACQPGDCSHMLAHHTEFIRRQIGVVLKRQPAQQEFTNNE